MPSSFTCASSSARFSSGTSRPSSSALIRIESRPLFLPRTIAAFGRDELGRVRLDRRRVVELRRDRARLAAEERLAGERLPWRERVARQLLDARGGLADPVEAQVGLDAVERAERERDLAEVGVAGALAHAVDRAVDPRRAGAHGRDRGRRSRRRSRCGRGSGPAPRRRPRRPCGRRARRPPRATRCRACRRRRPRARPPRPRSRRRARRSPARRGSSRRRRTRRGCRARRRSASRS